MTDYKRQIEQLRLNKFFDRTAFSICFKLSSTSFTTLWAISLIYSVLYFITVRLRVGWFSQTSVQSQDSLL